MQILVELVTFAVIGLIFYAFVAIVKALTGKVLGQDKFIDDEQKEKLKKTFVNSKAAEFIAEGLLRERDFEQNVWRNPEEK